jgi:polyhydroxyalkanoate synthesis regulator phasin
LVERIKFFQAEIRYFQNKILQIILKNLREINMEKVGEYRKAFLDDMLLIADFRKQILLREKALAEQKLATNELDYRFFREEMQEFKAAFQELRRDVKRFLAKSRKFLKIR